MTIKLDVRQSLQRDALDQLSNDVDLGLDTILNIINEELTPPLRLNKDPSSSNRRLYIGPIEVQALDPTSGTIGTKRNRTIQPIGNALPTFNGGYIEFPAASGGAITASNLTLASAYTLTLADDNFEKVMVSIDNQGQIVLTFGNEAATEAAATLPSKVGGTFAVGYVTVRNVAGTIQNIDDANIRQFVGADISGSFQTISSTQGANLATSSGNVGIGTASPSEKLDLVGNLKLTGGLAYVNIVTVSISSNSFALDAGAVVHDITSGTGPLNTITGGSDGKVILVRNSTGADLTVTNNSGSNGFFTGVNDDITIQDKATLTLRYDNTASRWNVVGGSGAGAGGTTDKVTQNGHGFAVGDVLYINTSTGLYDKAVANTAATAEVVGVVSKINSINIFELTLSGEIKNLTSSAYTEGSLPPAGETAFLSANPLTPGKLTITEPSAIGQVSVPIGVVSGSGTLYVAPKRGIVVGGTNARTEVSLSNNASTNIFNPAAYEAGELSGWVTIDGTLDYRFYISIKFSKKINNSDIDVSYQTSGDTPPAGFSVQYSSGPAQITMTLPNVGGFVTARINYALNAPAVGATFPLSIESTSVNFSTIRAKDSTGLTFRENDGASVGTVSDAGLWTLPSLTVSGNFVPSSPTGFRNAVINGSMVINQRGRDILRAATGTADDVQNIDRWIGYSTNQLHNSNRTLRVSQVTDSPSTVSTNRCAAMITENAADIGTLGLGQKIESSVACGLKNSSNQFTVSFWIKRTSSVGTTAKLCATVNAPASTDAWGGTFLRDSTNQISIIDDFGNLTFNQWVRRTATFNWVSDFDKGIGLLITVGHSQDGYTGATRPALVQNAECYKITGIQLEPGSVATPFEYVSFDHELRRCQRYFQGLAEPNLDYVGALTEWGLNTANSQVATSIPTRTSMRASPSYWEYQTSAGNTTRARLVGSGLSDLYPPNVAGLYNVTSASFYSGGTTSDVVVLVFAMSPAQNFTNIPTWDTLGGGWRLSANAELI